MVFEFFVVFQIFIDISSVLTVYNYFKMVIVTLLIGDKLASELYEKKR